MRVTASAPGKLVLMGEYAVLEGAPALVMAVDRLARVTLAERDESGWLIDAPAIGIHGARGERRGGDGRMKWRDLAPAERDKLQLAGGVINALAGEKAFHATLDTHAFHDGSGVKLGLGSSAAVTVALAGALQRAQDAKPPDVNQLIRLHREIQGGRGSGLDIAASAQGGVIVYRMAEGRPYIEPVAVPGALQAICVFSGASASTGDFLRRMSQWRDAEPREYRSLMNELGACASAGAMAIQGGDAETMVEAAGAYAVALAELGKASGVNIVSAEHVKIGRVAAECGLVYKPCGAGGGDIGVGLATDAERVARFQRRVSAAGFRTLDLACNPGGLAVSLNGAVRDGSGI